MIGRPAHEIGFPPFEPASVARAIFISGGFMAKHGGKKMHEGKKMEGKKDGKKFGK